MGARTYRNNVRTAWTRVMDELGAEAIPWATFVEAARKRFSEPGSVLHMETDRLVSEFLPPELTWHPDWSKLPEKGRLPADSRLPEYIRKRLLAFV